MIYIDNCDSSNPPVNLAIEEYLVRHADCSSTDYLLLYINQPAIVLGKNQCIYKEVNFDYLRYPSLKLARRISGGGAVYHDPGNVNFAFITSYANEKINNYKWFNQALIKALHEIGVETAIDERNNILCNGKKISGNAQFTNRKNIISHGTLLFNSDLPMLRACLKENEFAVHSRAVQSVKSAVCNMIDFTPGIKSAEHLKDYLKNKLTVQRAPLQFKAHEWNTILQLANDKFDSFEWVYGRSPAATIEKPEINIHVEHGKITGLENRSTYNLPDLSGVRYEINGIKEALENSKGATALRELVF